MSTPEHSTAAAPDSAPGEHLPPAAGSRPMGRVVYVGVPLGLVDLITLRGRQILLEADLVLADAAVGRVLDDPELALSGPSVRQVEPQSSAQQIADSCLDAVRQGSVVVRLVHGDPLLDADSAAEARLCAEGGAQIDLLPAVSALTAVPTLAGVNQHEGCVQFIRVDQVSSIELPARCSVVCRVRVAELAGLAEAALDAGRPADEAVLITCDGGSAVQHSSSFSLSGLGAAAEGLDCLDQDWVSVTIGAAARRPEALNWYENKPLFGWRILMPTTREPDPEVERRLRRHGASVQIVPTIAVEPPRNPQQMERALHSMVDGRYQWIIFTSGHAVRAVRALLQSVGLDARAMSGLSIAAIGSDSIELLEEWGLRPDLVPGTDHTSAALVAEFPAHDDLLDPINRVFLPRAEVSTETLCEGLAQLGWEVEDVTVFRTVRAAPPPAQTREDIKSGAFDAVIFTSSSTVRNLVGIAGKPPAQTLVAAIGAATVSACQEQGLRVDAVPPHPRAVELVDALAEHAVLRREQLITSGEPVLRPSQLRGRRRG